MEASSQEPEARMAFARHHPIWLNLAPASWLLAQLHRMAQPLFENLRYFYLAEIALKIEGHGSWKPAIRGYCSLENAKNQLILPAACCLLPAAYCHLLAACSLLPTALCLQPAAYCHLFAACCLLPTMYPPGDIPRIPRRSGVPSIPRNLKYEF